MKKIFIIRKMNRTTGIAVILMLLNILGIYGQGDKKYLRQGNNKYFKGDYNESEILYRKAIENTPSSTDAVFNLGDALYRQNKFEDASKHFSTSVEMSNENMKKAESYYNLGNSLLKNNKIEESIEAYKNSLRLNPSSMEAKYNLAYAQDLLKKMQQQQQQQQQQNEQQKEDENNNNQQQNQENQQQQQQNSNQNQANQDQQGEQQQKISKEDAERILNALANDEKKVQEKVKEAKTAQERVRTLINW